MIEIINQKMDRVLIQLDDGRKGRVRAKDLEEYFDALFGE